jgi:predicted nucleic-acid-binding protein
LTKAQFSDQPDIHPSTKLGITEVMGFQRMTEILAKTYVAALLVMSVLG